VAADTRVTIDRFLVLTYEQANLSEHAAPLPLATLAAQLQIPPKLAEKIADFLERTGLVNYDDQAVDLTIEGMLKVEELMRVDEAGPSVS
jgi:Mn-dependent DtxR family transcriptional regulator